MNYAKVYRHMWNDDKFRALPEDGRILWQYLLTCPMGNSFGYFVLDDGAAAGDLQWQTRRLTWAKKHLVSARMMKTHPQTRLIFLVHCLKYNQPDNPNVLKSWSKIIEVLPKCPGLFADFCDAAEVYLESNWAKQWAKGLREQWTNPSETLSKGLGQTLSKTRNPEPITHNPITTTPLPPSSLQGSGLSSSFSGNEFLLKKYREEIGEPTPAIRAEMDKTLTKFPPERVGEAIGVAAAAGHREWRYVAGILDNWSEEDQEKKEKSSAKEKDNLPVYEGDPEPEAAEMWQKALCKLKGQISGSNFRTWVSNTRGLALTETEFIIGVPNAFVADYLDRNQRSLIEKTLLNLTSRKALIILFRLVHAASP